MNIFYVYKHTFSSGAIYIGKGKGKRGYSFSNRNKIWIAHRNKYGDPLVEIVYSGLEEKESFRLEIKEIARNQHLTLLNMTVGGEGVSGYEASPELIARRNKAIKKAHSTQVTKDRVSRASKKAHSNPITKAKHRKSLSAAQTPELRALHKKNSTGRPQSAETRQKRSDSLKGRTFSDKHISNMSGSKHHSYNPEEHTFIHIELGEMTTRTTQYMRNTYGCRAAKLVNGEYKTSMGWSLI